MYHVKLAVQFVKILSNVLNVKESMLYLKQMVIATLSTNALLKHSMTLQLMSVSNVQKDAQFAIAKTSANNVLQLNH